MTKTLPKIALGAWAWGNDGTFGDNWSADSLKPMVEYKKVFKETVELFDKCLKKHLKIADQQSEQIRYAFLPYMYGIYPYSYPTEKQISAMDEVKLSHVDVTIYEMTYQFLKLVL